MLRRQLLKAIGFGIPGVALGAFNPVKEKDGYSDSDIVKIILEHKLGNTKDLRNDVLVRANSSYGMTICNFNGDLFSVDDHTLKGNGYRLDIRDRAVHNIELISRGKESAPHRTFYRNKEGTWLLNPVWDEKSKDWISSAKPA